MTTEWKDQSLLLDILIAAKRAIEFTAGLSQDDFISDEKTQSAVVYQIQIIDEAARRLSAETRQAHSEVDWTNIVGMRNRLVHDYSRIDIDIVWDVVSSDLPSLVAAVQPLVPPPEDV
jgi:uncharacterized protein with HEPN domain